MAYIESCHKPNNLSKTDIDEITVNDSVITDKSITVNKFNEYFVNVSQTLAANIASVPGDVISYILNNDPNSMCVDNININEINKKNILVQNQYGFCEKHSTFMALLKLVDYISNEVNNKILLEYSLIFQNLSTP